MQRMSTTAEPIEGDADGVPGLSALGRRLELLRLDRGLSKQGLARQAGTSRQQLWRIMTGKSELTTSLCQRLADVLGVDTRVLRKPDAYSNTFLAARSLESSTHAGRAVRRTPAWRTDPAPTVAEYLTDPRFIARTLATCPGGSEGRLLKRRLLDGLEDAAREAGVRLPPAFFTVRGRVVNGEL